jgi:ribosomal protein S12 methylthiotransferase accessory factor
MLNRPQFKPHYRAEVVPGEGVFLLSETVQTVLQGRLYELVAPLLDGRPVTDICRGLRGYATAAQVYYTLAQLEKKGYLAEVDGAFPPGEVALLSIQDIDPALAARRLADTAVAVRAFGDVDAEPFRALLRSLRLRLEEPGDLGVVLTDSYQRDALEVCNREALRDGRPWLVVKPVGCQIWVGPLFRPGLTGCWECLAQRLRANYPVAGYLQSKNGHGGALPIDRSQTPATLAVAWGLAATAVANWVARGELPALEGKVQTLDLLSYQIQSHSLVRQPYCPVCGQPPPAPDRPLPPLVLQSRKKSFTADGGHRAASPQATVGRYGHHVSPVCGAVSMLDRDAPSDNEVLHVYVSGHNIARHPRSWARLRNDLRNCSSGKGTSDLQARASALCEGLERYSGIFRGDEPRRTARLCDLGEAGIHPNACMLFSDKQYRESDAWNPSASCYQFVPEPFDSEAEIEWSPVWSLTRQAVRYLPTAFCYFNYPHAPAKDYCAGCSNGNAAGNTLEEAILQGFLELVERDSVALWWYNRVQRPAVAIDSFAEPYLDRLREFLREKHRDLWVLDLTSDLTIPAFVALSRRTDGEGRAQGEQIMFGFGAHLDPRVALLRAVTELNQFLSRLLCGPPDDPPAAQLTDAETVRWLRTATVADHPYLLPQDTPPRTVASYPPTWTDDLKDDVLTCQALVERHALEMLVLDQTRPEIGLPVVKVIVPGLRHFWARFAPGRLYDVPARLGWLPRPLAEGRLNPIPMFL